MNNQAESNQVAFLQGTWRAVLHDQPEPFRKSLLADFVSVGVMARLPEQTTLKNVLAECHEQAAFQESYIKSFLSLKRVWNDFSPESRHTINQYIHRFGLQKSLRLQPHEDDEAALTIRWDTANRVYASCRDAVFAACRAHGLELNQPRGLPQASEFRATVRYGQEKLLGLLRERVNTDKTAVTLAVGYVTPVARTKILNNLNSAYLESLDAFRGALFHWALHNLESFHSIELFHGVHTGATLTKFQESVLREHVEGALWEFTHEYEKLRQSVKEMPQDPTIYEKARRFFEIRPAVH